MSVPPIASCSCLSELLLVPLPCYPWPLGRTLHRISRFEGDPHCIEGTLLALLARARCMSEESEVSYAARFVGGRPRPCTRLAAYSITACLTLCMASSSPTASFSTFLALHTCVFCKTCKLSESKLTASSLHNFGKSSPNCLIKNSAWASVVRPTAKIQDVLAAGPALQSRVVVKKLKNKRLKASVHTGYFSRRALHEALVATWKQEQRLVVSSMRYEFFCLLPLLPPGKVQATSRIAVRKSFTNATQSSEGICRCTALSSASGTCPSAIASRTAYCRCQFVGFAVQSHLDFDDATWEFV